MTAGISRPRAAQRGVVLIAAILLLVVMTLLALGMFHNFGIQELVAGNVREKQRALQSAEAAEQYGEMWLTAPGNVLTNSVDCSSVGLVTYGASAVPYICMKPVAAIDDAGNAYTVPWNVNSHEVGFVFFPGATTGAGVGGTSDGDLAVSTSASANSYYQPPRLYIGLVSSSATQALYRIDAWNYAATTTTSAVVESNYVVTCNTCSVTGP
jgi:Tfp pilus assembly protein PilX